MELKELSGLLARSHGMNLRDTFEYIKEEIGDEQNWKNPFDVHIIYLMVLLRVSDYLHFTSDRASIQVLKIREISSPFSKIEWNAHNAIKHLNINHEDHETIFVQADPQSSQVFLRLKQLFEGIQYEFDTSWATLG